MDDDGMHWCIFCESWQPCLWWSEEDCGGWACEDEDGCRLRRLALCA